GRSPHLLSTMSFVDDLLEKLPLERFRNPPPQVAVLRLDGLIAARGPRSLSLRRLAGAIERAFALRNLKAVALAVNSPGGSPVQSSLISRRVRQLAQEKEVPVVAFAEDVAASGGYWLALAADEIFAEDTSLVGSIGVITASFGFAEALRRLGAPRRQAQGRGEHDLQRRGLHRQARARARPHRRHRRSARRDAPALRRDGEAARHRAGAPALRFPRPLRPPAPRRCRRHRRRSAGAARGAPDLCKVRALGRDRCRMVVQSRRSTPRFTLA